MGYGIWDGCQQGHKPWLFISKNSPMDKDTGELFVPLLHLSIHSLLLLALTLPHPSPFHLSTFCCSPRLYILPLSREKRREKGYPHHGQATDSRGVAIPRNPHVHTSCLGC